MSACFAAPCCRCCFYWLPGAFPAQILQLYTADGRIQQAGTVYFKTVALAYLPMALSTVLSAWLRCKEHAAIPFWASLGAVAANTGLNYLLIFGKLGFAPMGVQAQRLPRSFRSC